MIHFKNNERKLTTLVENRTLYQSEFSELNVYETHQVAEKVSLTFDYPIIASMLQGKKIMHLKDMEAFDFVPGESVVMPADEEMIIDFPIARRDNPTQCLALGIEDDKVQEVMNRFNYNVAIENENNTWSLTETSSCLLNDEAVNFLVHRLVKTFRENTQSRDVLLDLMIQELIVRLLQTKARFSIVNDVNGVFSDTRIGSVIQYIKNNLTNKDIGVELLAEKACMSISTFHKKFKNTLGVSPIDYINSEKIKFAKQLMKKRRDLQISEVAFLSGFNHVSYFNRQFKRLELMTPNDFRKNLN